jgi:MFS family permease
LPVRRLGPFLLLGQLAWAVPGTASSTLLAALIGSTDAAHKVEVYTLFAAAGAITSAIGTVLGGLLSDRTRSRLGRRTPWLVAAALVAAVSLVGTGLAGNVFLAGALYAIFQLGVGTWVAVLSVLIPDHVAAGSVGRASAFAGFGYLLGQTLGGAIAGALVTTPRPGLIITPWIMVAGAVVIVVFVRERDNRADPAPVARRLAARDLLPSAPRDFWLAFAGRFLFILAIVLVVTFQLYLLTDYLHLSTKAAGHVLSTATLLVGGLSAISVIIAGTLSDRTRRIKPFVIGAPFLLAIGLVPFLIAPSVPAELVFFGAVGLTLGAYLSVDQALMVAVLPSASTTARDLGFLAIGSTLPGVVAPIAGGIIAATIGYLAIFVLALVLAVAAAAVIFAIRSVR